MFQNLFKFISSVFLLMLFLFPQNSFAQLFGTYTIPGTLFATITEAVDSLNQVGVGAGGVTFNVTGGYTENLITQILLTASGTSSDPIVFQKSGAGANPLITRTDAGTLSTSILGGQGDAVIIIQGSDYVTFDAIDVAASNQGIEYGYYLRKASSVDGCKFVTIKNASVTMTKGTSEYVVGIYSSNNVAASLTSSADGITVTSVGGCNEGVEILGNTVSQVFTGIIVRGFNHTAAPYNFYDQNFVVGANGAGNTIRNYAGNTAQTAYGIYMIYHNNLTISYNTMNNTAGGGSSFTAIGYGVFTSTATSVNINITHNNVSLTSIGTTQLMHGINNAAGSTAAGNTINITNNTVTGCSYTSATTAAFTGIVNSGSAATVNVHNNTVQNNTLAGTGTFTGIDGGGATTTTLNMFANTVNGNQKTGASGSMFNFRGSGGTVNAYDNNIFDNSFTASSGTSSCIMYGYYLSSSNALVENIYNNNIYNLTVIGTNTGTASLLNGIHTSSVATAVKNIYGNNIYNLTARSGNVNAIAQSLGTEVQIYKNNIYNLSNSTTVTTAATMCGMLIASGTVYIFNNFISDLRNPASASPDAIRAINITSATITSTIGLYYNSIYLDASSSGLNFGTTGIYHTFNATPTTAVLDMRNNVIVNNSTPKGTGLTVAFRRSAATSLDNYGSASNNNAFYAGVVPNVARLIFFDGTNSDQTIATYKARVAPRDAQSVSENPPFVNVSTTPYDLHMNTLIATQTESGGTPVSTPVAITTDYDDDTRNATTPDVGADEFAGIALDLTPPVIVYTPLLITGSTSNRTLAVTITDDPGSGVPTAGIGLPVLYWKKNYNGIWTSATAETPTGSNYPFMFGSGVVAGDTVFYYVVAQDGAPSPNVGAFPSEGAGGFTANPPAAANPPTNLSSYFITNVALAGNYAVGLLMFNQITGKNIYFEKVVQKVMKEVDVEVPVVLKPVEKGKEIQDFTTETSYKPQTIKQLREVEEISWIPMENGQRYLGDLYVKKFENPQLSLPDGIDGVYATITAAVADLNLRGVSDATTFLLNDATYPTETFPITINVANESKPTSTNAVTIKPNTDVTSLIQGASLSSQIFEILTSYVNINGSNAGGTDRSLTIENTASISPQVVVFGSTGTSAITGGSLKNCIIINGATTSNAVVVSDGAAPGTAGYFTDITIQNNSIQKAYIGVYCIAVVASGNGNGLFLTGNDLTTSDAMAISLVGLYLQGIDGAIVSNNNIGNYTTTYTSSVTGIWFATGTINSTISNNTIGPINITTTAPIGIVVTSGIPNANVTISGNTISGMITSSSSTPYGIRVFSTTTGVTIEKNKVHEIRNTNTGGYGARGIHVSTGLASTNITIKNNFVWDVKATSDVGTTYWGIGIGIEGATGGVNVYHNSVHLYGSLAGYSSGTIHAAFAVINSIVNTLNVRDNIFVNSFNNTNSTTDKSYAINTQTDGLAFTDIDYNDYYVSGVPGILGYCSVDRLTLLDWQTATGKDTNSLSVDPHFASHVDLHIDTAYNTVGNKGVYIASVPTDIDGDTRNATTPDIGADEYTYVPLLVADPTNITATAISDSQIVVAFTPNAGSNNVVIVFNLTGTFTTPTGTPPTPGDPFAGGTLIYNGTTSPYNHTGLTQLTNYYYKLFSYDNTNYSPGVAVDATTPAIPIGVPYSQTFDASTLPPYWSQSSTNWTVSNTAYAGGAPYEMRLTWFNFVGSTRLIVGPINTNDLTGLNLGFNHFYDDYGPGINFKIQSSTDKVTWIDEAFTFTSGSGNIGPVTVNTTIANNLGSVTYIAFVSTGDHTQLDYWCVDNVLVSLPLPNDVGTLSIDVASFIDPVYTAPQATVRNYGINTQTFSVRMTITGGYSSTKTVTSLAPGASRQVTFDNWNANPGIYTINACTQLGTDQNTANDCLNKVVSVGDISGTWTSGSIYPTTTYLGSGVGAAGFLYSMGGNTASSLGVECFKYNEATNIWTPIESLPTGIPTGRRVLATAVVGNFIYAIAGLNMLNEYQSTVYKYDIVGDSWSTVAPLPIAMAWGKAVGYNNKIYLAGGVDALTPANVLSSVYVYDVVANTWATATSMPGARFGGAFSVSGNMLVYVAGADLTNIYNTVFVGTIDSINPAVITWTTMDNTVPGVDSRIYSEYAGSPAEFIANQRDRKTHLPEAVSYPTGGMFRFDAAPWGTDGIIVATGSPTTAWTPANPSPCYVYKPETDSWIEQKNVPLPVLGSSLGTVNNGNEWKLIVASGYTGSVETNATQIYTKTLGDATFQLTVNVSNGWNMVSIPGLHPTDQNVNTWWAFRDPGANVFRYAGEYQSVTDAVPGIGYWMKHAGARTYNTGEEWPVGGIQIVAHDPIAAESGWNLFGGYELSVTTANVTTNPPGLQNGPIYKYSGGYQVATTIDPGYGYWMKLDAAGQIIIPETLAKEGKPVEYFAEDWGKIVLTDATGIHYTLYAVKGEVDLTQYELPPAPPTGMFDIRYSSHRIAEDINSAIKTIDLNGVTYPLTVRVEGMDIRLMDETGKNVNVNLKAGEDIVISDASVMKLMVSGELIPAKYALEQNYPNPFNPSTVIEFSLPEDVSNVKLSIYNALGEKVAELVNTALTAGKYQYQWNASNVATGMYIYELRTDNFVSVKKMLLLK